MEIVGKITLTVIAMILGTLTKGYTLSVLWGWFVIGTFDVPPITIPQACGLGLLVSYITHQYVHVEDKRTYEEKMIAAILAPIIFPAVALSVGWVILQFMG
jgi:hypothetical protein